MHVANQYPKYNPYAVCTKSVYQSAGKKRKGVVRCADTYNFEDFETEELRGYARMKNARTVKISGAEKISRDDLISALYRFVASEKGREVWQEYAKRYRKENPKLTFSEAMKQASKEYQSGRVQMNN